MRIAPKIDDYKITKGARFKRTLPEREMFVFKDEKEANEFYNYINTKYQLNNENVMDDVPFQIDGEQYFFSFYEVAIPNKGLNLFPIVADVFLNVSLGKDHMDPIISNSTVPIFKSAIWYIAIEVYRDSEKDCLQENSLSREPVLKYLRTLKKEYLSTYNYNETLFRN